MLKIYYYSDTKKSNNNIAASTGEGCFRKWYQSWRFQSILKFKHKTNKT